MSNCVRMGALEAGGWMAMGDGKGLRFPVVIAFRRRARVVAGSSSAKSG